MTRPNILLIMANQHRFDHLGYMGRMSSAPPSWIARLSVARQSSTVSPTLFGLIREGPYVERLPGTPMYVEELTRALPSGERHRQSGFAHRDGVALAFGCRGAAPERPGEFRVGIEGTPTTLDPRYATDAYGVRMLPLLFNGLLAQTPSGEFRPDLAESWEQPNPTTIICHIRKGVQWQNLPPVNGRELDANDVAWSMNRFIGVKTGTFTARPYVDSVTATDKWTVIIKMKVPYFNSIQGVAGAIHVAPHEVVDKFGNIQVVVGKKSFDSAQLVDNINAVVDTVKRIRPSTVKGIYIRSAVISSSMGPGVKIEI